MLINKCSIRGARPDPCARPVARAPGKWWHMVVSYVPWKGNDSIVRTVSGVCLWHRCCTLTSCITLPGGISLLPVLTIYHGWTAGRG